MNLEEAIEAIWDAGRRGIHFPPEWKGRFGLDDACRIQLGLLARHLRAGERQAGWKVGLTSRAIQEQEGFFEPAFGYLLESAALPSGCEVAFGSLRNPACENELCLTVGRTLRGPGVSEAQAREAVAAVAPALELVEWRGVFSASPSLAIADNLGQKAFVTGEATDPLPAGVSLREATVEVTVDGAIVERADGSAVLGDPAASLAWLANKLAQFDRVLEAGMRVMSGSFTRGIPLRQGQRVESRFRPFGTVSLTVR
jgi:2-keto-4-pentenoate hydratase